MGLFKNARLHKSPHKPDHERKISAVDTQPEDFDNYTNRSYDRQAVEYLEGRASIAIEEDKKLPAAEDSQIVTLLTRPEGKGHVESSLLNANQQQALNRDSLLISKDAYERKKKKWEDRRPWSSSIDLKYLSLAKNRREQTKVVRTLNTNTLVKAEQEARLAIKQSELLK